MCIDVDMMLASFCFALKVLHRSGHVQSVLIFDVDVIRSAVNATIDPFLFS